MLGKQCVVISFLLKESAELAHIAATYGYIEDETWQFC